jgi:hypothetical protein
MVIIKVIFVLVNNADKHDLDTELNAIYVICISCNISYVTCAICIYCIDILIVIYYKCIYMIYYKDPPVVYYCLFHIREYIW